MEQLAFRTLSFSDLSTIELYQLLKLRSEIFVVEQDCVYLDLDDEDKSAYHIMGYSGTQLAVYSRILPPENGIAHIGRVIVSQNFRGKQLGRSLMRFSMQKVQEIFDVPIQLAAQSYLKEFYESLGFEISGSEYILDGIPHIDMHRNKPK